MNNGGCNMGMNHRQAELSQVNTVFETPILDKTIEEFDMYDDEGDYCGDPDQYWDDLKHEAEHMMDDCIGNIDTELYANVVVEPDADFAKLNAFQKRLVEMGLKTPKEILANT